METSAEQIKKVLYSMWDKEPVLDYNKLKMIGLSHQNDWFIRKTFIEYLGGTDAVIKKAEDILKKTFNASSGGYNFKFKVMDNYEIYEQDVNDGDNALLLSDVYCLVDPNGEVTLSGFDGNTYTLQQIYDNEIKDADVAWEVGNEVEDVIKDTLYQELTRHTGIEIGDVYPEHGTKEMFQNRLEEMINRIKNLL